MRPGGGGHTHGQTSGQRLPLTAPPVPPTPQARRPSAGCGALSAVLTLQSALLLYGFRKCPQGLLPV